MVLRLTEVGQCHLGDVEPEETRTRKLIVRRRVDLDETAGQLRVTEPGLCVRWRVRTLWGGSRVGLWSANLGSRRTSSSLRDPPIIPSVTSHSRPPSNLHSDALIRGDPSARGGRQRLVGAGLEAASHPVGEIWGS